MIAIGVAFIAFWLGIIVLGLSVTTAAAIVGVGFVLLGLILGERRIS